MLGITLCHKTDYPKDPSPGPGTCSIALECEISAHSQHPGKVTMTAHPPLTVQLHAVVSVAPLYCVMYG